MNRICLWLMLLVMSAFPFPVIAVELLVYLMLCTVASLKLIIFL